MKRIILFFAAVVASSLAFGQQPQQLPNDPAVRTGKLDNGLTYYIRHNDKPAGRAEFYLATNVGAIQETPDQDGLAHFLEHMCFNGTKNLPGKTMLDYLQKIGAEFGRNINAATGVEQTTYMLNNMPVSREGIIDTCLLIMHDYSHFVTCDPVEIDKERGVIIEEKRTRNDAGWRMHVKSLPYYYGDSKYATCTLIGSQENLETFRPESLVNFYRTWYRPDLQAVIVVGDIDVDQIEGKIKALFSDIPAAENPQPKEMHKIPDNEKPVVGIITDPEASSTSIEVLWKSEPMPEELNSTDMGMFMDLLKTYVYYVMAERFGDITAKPDAPFLGASLGIGGLCETCEVVMGSVSCRDGEAIPAFRAFLTEIEKMKRFGFTEAEVSRAKENILSSYEKAAEGADTRENSAFIQPLINHFFDNYAYMEPAAEYELAKALCAQISAPLLNQVVAQLITEDNMVIVCKAPEKEGLVQPTEDEFLKTVADIESADIQPNAEEAATEPFLNPSDLKGSKVKKEEEGLYGSTVWTLKNGVKVIVLPTEYKKDQVIIQLYKDGGESLIPTEDLCSFEDNIFGLYLSNTGVSRFASTQVSKMLAGKKVSVSPFISSVRHGIGATSTPKDIETALQLMYLYFVEPRFDADEFNTGISQIRAVLPNVVNQPNYKFQNALYSTLYGNDPRVFNISEEVVDKASLEAIERNYRNLFDDAAGAVVAIVGNVDMATLKPMVEKYIGSLPKGKKPETWNADNTSRMVKGEKTNHFTVPMETPKATVLQVYSSYFPYSVRNEVLFDAVKYILDMVYTETLREEEGGTYGAGVFADMQIVPENRETLQVYFDTNPESAEKLSKLAVEGLRKLMEEGPTQEQLTMTIENFKKKVPENRISNTYWISNLLVNYRYGIDQDAEYEAAISEITADNIKSILRQMLDEGNFVEVIMSAETAE